MKLFFDTCTIIDYLCNRNNSSTVDKILQFAEERKWQCIMSAGAFYTITYLLELDLKRNGFIDKQARIARLREILNGVLDTFVIPELDWTILYEGVNNIAFTDLEDSYQYEVACRIASNYLITDNLNDYKNSDQTIISILSPVEFLSRVRGMTY